MRKSRAHACRHACSESGQTLIELLMSVVIGLVVFGAVMMLVPMAFNQSSRSQERTQRVADTRIAVERVLREVRTASAPTGSSNAITYTLPTGVTVRIECSPGQGQGDQGTGQGGGNCRRFTVPPGRDDGKVIVDNIGNPGSVFCITKGSQQARGWVGMNLQLNVPGTTSPVTIDDGTALRNVGNVGVIEPCLPS